MKKIFTKTIYVIATLFLSAGIWAPTFAQAPITTITPDAGVSAIAKDNSGNTYVIENPGSFDAGKTPKTDGEIVRYTAGSGASKVVYSGAFIADNDYLQTDAYAFGIVVDASKNIYFTTSNGQSFAFGAIIKLTYNSGTDTYSDGGAPYIDFTSQGGNIGYPTGLAMDASNRLYVLQYNVNDDPSSGGFGAYTVARYAAGSTTSYTEIYQGLELTGTFHVPDTYSSICALAVDPSGNVYVADWFDTRIPANYGGFIEKLTYDSVHDTYAASQLLNNAYCQALGSDASGNIYANIATAANENSASLVKFTGGAGAPTTIYAGLNGEFDYWCFGMAVIGSDIYTSQGNEGTQSQGYYMHIVAPPTSASNVSFSGTTEQATTISFTSGTGSNRAIFVANASTGTPAPVNSTGYTANATFGNAGSQIGTSGWYCVYNGNGTSPVSISGLSANTTYRAMVVEYSGSAGLQNYNVTNVTNNPNNVTTLVAPALTASGGTDNYSQGGAAVVVDAGITVTAGQTNLNTATINISTARSTGDLLNFTNQNGITGSFTAATGVLTLSGSSSVANYQTALQSITFSSSSLSTTTRTISFSVGDGTSNSNTVTKNITVTASTSLSSIALVNAATNNLSSVQYTVTFAATVGGLGTTNFTATVVSGSISGQSVTGVSASNPYTVTVNTGSGSGVLRLDLTSNSGLSPVVSNEPYTSGPSYTIDRTAPAVSSVGVPANGSYGASQVLNFTVNFSKNVTVTGTPQIGLTIGSSAVNASYVSGTGTATLTFGYVVAPGNNDSDGISVAGAINLNGGTIADALGNTATLTLNGVGSTTGVLVDTQAPSVSSITATTPSNTNPTNATSVTYTVTFSEGVTGVDNTDFTFTSGGASPGGVNVIPVSSNVYTVVVSGISGDGTLRLDLKSSGTGIADLAGNAISSGFTGGDTYTFDHTAPVVNSITATGASPTNATSVGYTVTFSEGVTGVDNTDFTATVSGVSTTGVTVTPVNGSTYTVTVNGLSGSGTVRLDLNGSGTGIADLAGNAIAGGFTGGDTYTIDQTAPTVLSIAATDPIQTNETQLDYQATFSEPVTGVDASDFTATTGGVSTGTISVTPLSSTVYNITVNSVSGDGTLRLDLNSSGTGIADLVGNPISSGFTGGDTYNVDQTPPTATIGAPSLASIGNSGSGTVTYTVTYSDANFSSSNLTTSGITLNTTGTATGTIGVSGSGTSYTVTISGITGLGTIGISVGAGFASDLAGNTDAGAGASATFNVLSSDATLSSLATSQGTLTPIFSSGQMSYTADVSNAISSIMVTPASSDPNATIQVNGVTVPSGTQSGSIALAEGVGTTINTVVTAQDGTTMDTYSITVTRAPSGNARLSTIALTPYASLVNTGTVGATTTYTALVGNGVTSVTLTPAAQDPTATITVDGVTVPSGTASGSITLGAEGSNTTITTVVTSQNGSATRTYSIVVTRAPSSDARLSTIALTPYTMLTNTGTIGTTTTYTASVSGATASVTVTPTAIEPNATIQVNGVTVTSGTASGSFALGAEGSTTTLTTVVTAQDGTTTRTYSIAITRTPSGDPRLATIVMSPYAGLANTGTVGTTTTYTTAVINAVSSVTFTPTAIDPNAVITVDGIGVASGTASGSITLAEGQTTVTIVSTSQDGSRTRTYSIAVTRPSTDNAELSTIALTPASLLVNTGTVGSTTSYTTSVDNATTSVTVTPTTLDPNATVTVDGVAVPSGTASGSIALTVGQTTITTIVTAVDGIVTRTYSIVVTRASGPLLSLYQPVQQVSVTKPADAVAIENDGIMVHQGVSPNGDGINDVLTIDGITAYPDNSLMIIDRNGSLIYQAKGYDNSSKAFDGHSSINGRMQQAGTYFYSLDYVADGQNKHKTGYILLKY